MLIDSVIFILPTLRESVDFWIFVFGCLVWTKGVDLLFNVPLSVDWSKAKQIYSLVRTMSEII